MDDPSNAKLSSNVRKACAVKRGFSFYLSVPAHKSPSATALVDTRSTTRVGVGSETRDVRWFHCHARALMAGRGAHAG